VGKSTKKSPMKRRCAIISCSQNINYINSRSQKPVTALVPDNKPITKFNMLEIPPPPFPMHILNLSTNTWVGNTGYIRKVMNKTKGTLTITQTNVSVNKPISLIHIIIRKVHDKIFPILMNTGGAHHYSAS
jgi:hypothetical protein